MKKKETLKGRVMLVLLAASWGGTFPAMKIAVLDLDVFFFLLLRFCVALAAFIPLLALTHKRIAPDPRGLGLGAVVFLGFLFQVFGLKYTTAINSAFITSLNTPLVPILGFLIFHRKPGLRAVLGIAIGMLGLTLLTGAYEMKSLSIGDLLTFICAFLWALQILLVDKAAKKVDALELAYSEAISVFALSTIFSLSVGEVWKTPGGDAAIAVVYTGAVATAFAFYAQAWAQRWVPPEVAGLILLLEPVFASIFAFLILGETLDLIEALGAALILLGVGISE